MHILLSGSILSFYGLITTTISALVFGLALLVMYGVIKNKGL